MSKKKIRNFSSINESVWEHLKLLFFPMLLTIIIGCFYIGKEAPNFLCSKTIGIQGQYPEFWNFFVDEEGTPSLLGAPTKEFYLV